MGKVLVWILLLPKTLLTKLTDSLHDAAGVRDRDILPTDVLVDPKKD